MDFRLRNLVCWSYFVWQESINSGERNYRRLLDADALGNTPSDGSKPYEPPPARFNPGSNGELVHCAEVVAKGQSWIWRDTGWDVFCKSRINLLADLWVMGLSHNVVIKHEPHVGWLASNYCDLQAIISWGWTKSQWQYINGVFTKPVWVYGIGSRWGSEHECWLETVEVAGELKSRAQSSKSQGSYQQLKKRIEMTTVDIYILMAELSRH